MTTTFNHYVTIQAQGYLLVLVSHIY